MAHRLPPGLDIFQALWYSLNMTDVCYHIVEVRGGQAAAAVRNCSRKVVYVDPKGRGWCKRHQPDPERKAIWEKSRA